MLVPLSGSLALRPRGVKSREKKDIRVKIGKQTLRLTHLYSDAAGDSKVEEIDYAMTPTADGAKAEHIAVSGLTFRLWDGAPPVHDLHTTSKPQLVIHLVGSVEVECTDGAKRVLQSGDIMVSENLTGKGHYSNELSQPRLQQRTPPHTAELLPRQHPRSPLL